MMVVDVIKSFSHEINNSLQSIQFTNDSIDLHGNLKEDYTVVKYSERIALALDKINKIFLPFSSNQKIFENFELNDSIKESLSFVKTQCESSLTRIFCDYQNLNLIGSKTIFIQVIINSLINLMNAGHKEIKIFTKDRSLYIESSNDIKDLSFDFVISIGNQINYHTSTTTKGVKINLNSIEIKQAS